MAEFAIAVARKAYGAAETFVRTLRSAIACAQNTRLPPSALWLRHTRLFFSGDTPQRPVVFLRLKLKQDAAHKAQVKAV